MGIVNAMLLFISF